MAACHDARKGGRVGMAAPARLVVTRAVRPGRYKATQGRYCTSHKAVRFQDARERMGTGMLLRAQLLLRGLLQQVAIACTRG